MRAWRLRDFSRVQLFVTLWTVALKAPLSTGFSKQEHLSGLPRPPPGDRLYPGIKSASLMPPALAGRFFTSSTTWETHFMHSSVICQSKLQWDITSHWSEWPLWKKKKTLWKINAGEDVEKREPSYTVGEDVNWYIHYEEQYGGFFKNQK